MWYVDNMPVKRQWLVKTELKPKDKVRTINVIFENQSIKWHGLKIRWPKMYMII